MTWLHGTHSCGVCASLYIQQEVCVEMFHAAVEGIEVFHPITGSCESAWMCGAQNSSVQHVMYVEVLNTKPSDLRVSTTETCRLWRKWTESPQTGSVRGKPSESEDSASEAIGKGELHWAELSWAELTWDDLRWASLSWARLRWCELSWDETRWDELKLFNQTELSWAELSWVEMRWDEMSKA